MIHDLYQQDLEIQATYKGDSQRLRGKARKDWLNNSPFQKLQRSLREVFSLELVVGTFNPVYQTVLKVNVRQVTQKESGEFVPVPPSKYALRDIMAMGSGFLQWINIYCVLLGQSVDTLVLDEPDAHLHATLQSELLNRITSISSDMRKQIMIATHSSEMIKTADLSSIFWVENKKYLHEEKSRTKIMHGIGVIHSPRFFNLQKNKRILFVENESDYRFLKIFSEVLETPLLHDVELWYTTDDYKNVRKLFSALSEEIDGLKAIHLKDRDTNSLNSINCNLIFKGFNNNDKNLLCLMWRRTNIESYLLNPNAIAFKSKNENDVEKIKLYFQSKHALSFIDDGGYVESNPPQAIMTIDGKKAFEMPDGIEKTFGCDKFEVAEGFTESEVCEDICTFIDTFNRHFSNETEFDLQTTPETHINQQETTTALLFNWQNVLDKLDAYKAAMLEDACVEFEDNLIIVTGNEVLRYFFDNADNSAAVEKAAYELTGINYSVVYKELSVV